MLDFFAYTHADTDVVADAAVEAAPVEEENNEGVKQAAGAGGGGDTY
jgi:hypothetical protein